MINKNYKQIFGFAVCVLLAPQALYGSTQKINDIELKVSDCAEKRQDVLVSTINPITSAKNSITAGQFLQKGIHPVCLKISNNSKDSIVISSKSIIQECIGADQAAGMFHIDHMVTSYMVAEACAITLFTFPVGIIAGPGYWYAAKHYITTTNEQLSQAFNEMLTGQDKKGKSVRVDKKGNCVIKSGASVTKIVLFNEEDELSQFTFQVFDEQGEKTLASFEVKLED